MLFLFPPFWINPTSFHSCRATSRLWLFSFRMTLSGRYETLDLADSIIKEDRTPKLDRANLNVTGLKLCVRVCKFWGEISTTKRNRKIWGSLLDRMYSWFSVLENYTKTVVLNQGPYAPTPAKDPYKILARWWWGPPHNIIIYWGSTTVF